MILRTAATRNASAVPDDQRNLEPSREAALWADFAAPSSAAAFYRSWLGIQCGSVARALAGALLVEGGNGGFTIAATWPSDIQDVGDLAAAAGPALQERRGTVHYLPDRAGQPSRACVAFPVEVDERVRAVVVAQVAAGSAADLQATMRRLHWGAGWLETFFHRAQSRDVEARIGRMAFAMDVLSDAGEQKELYACAVALANALAVRLSCSRVSIGIARRDQVHLIAISHSAVFEKRSTLAEATENAMEEALIQREAITLPGDSSTMGRVSLAHQELMRATAAASIASVVMTSADQPVGVITLERDCGHAFDAASVQTLETTGHLLGPLLEMKVERQRLIGGRLIDAAASSLTALVGRRRPALKLAAVAALGLLAYGLLAQGDFRVSGKAVVEGAVQRAAVAPFEGFVSTAPVRAGDVVTAGQILATLDDRELNLELLRMRSEYQQQIVKYSDALGERDAAAARLAAALIQQAKAQLAQAQDKLDRAKIVAPFSGIVVSGDLRQRLGSPVEKGQMLFELAPLDSFRAILQVDERDIPFVTTGQSGRLVLTGFTGRSFPFVVKSVTPVATASEGRNFFAVEADIQDSERQLRPGMEGVGKIFIQRRHLWWIWTRPLIEWARLLMWKWAP